MIVTTLTFDGGVHVAVTSAPQWPLGQPSGPALHYNIIIFLYVLQPSLSCSTEFPGSALSRSDWHMLLMVGQGIASSKAISIC